MIDRTSYIPLYGQIKNQIISDIKNGKYSVHTPIPSETTLQRDYGVSITTIKKALSELINEGYLYRKRGIGTFVSAGLKPEVKGYKYPVFNSSELIKLSGKNVSKKIISFYKSDASSEITQKLNVPENEEIYVFKRVFYGDNNPVCYAITHIPCKYVPNFINDISDIETEFHEYLRGNNLDITKFIGSIDADNIHDEDILSVLQIHDGDACIILHSFNCLADSTPIEYTYTVVNNRLISIPIQFTSV